jgi:hypothetical protein
MLTKLIMTIYLDVFEIDRSTKNIETFYEVTPSVVGSLKNFLISEGMEVGIDSGENLKEELKKKFDVKLKPIPGCTALSEYICYLHVHFDEINDFIKVLRNYKTDKKLAYIISKSGINIDLTELGTGGILKEEDGFKLIIFPDSSISHLEKVKTITL